LEEYENGLLRGHRLLWPNAPPPEPELAKVKALIRKLKETTKMREPKRDEKHDGKTEILCQSCTAGVLVLIASEIWGKFDFRICSLDFL